MASDDAPSTIHAVLTAQAALGVGSAVEAGLAAQGPSECVIASAAGLVVGAVLGLPAGLLVAWRRRVPSVPRAVRPGAAVMAACAFGVGTTAFFVFGLVTFQRFPLIIAATILAGLLALIFGLVLGGAVRRVVGAGLAPLRRRWPRATVTVASLVLFGALFWLTSRTWEGPGGPIVPTLLRDVLVAAAAGVAAGRATAAWVGHRPLRWGWSLLALPLMLPLVWPFAAVDPLSPWGSRSLVLGLADRALAATIDVDGDGVAGLWSGGDCAPFDAERHPWSPEIAGDGPDRDCADARPMPDTPALLRPAPAERTILITVDGVTLDTLDATAELAPAMASARRFTRAAGLRAPPTQLIPLLLTGEPSATNPPHPGALRAGAPSIPWLAESVGGRAFADVTRPFSFRRMGTVFRRQRARIHRKADRVVGRLSRSRTGGRAFHWLHVKRGRTVLRRLGRALAARRPSDAVVLVNLPSPKALPSIRDGAGVLAIWGPGVPPGPFDVPVGLHDVYPTLLRLTGTGAARAAFGPEPLIGLPLDGSTDEELRRRDGALGGDLASGIVTALDSEGRARPALVSDLHRTPARRRRNRVAEAGRASALPDDLMGAATTMAHGVIVHGCTFEPLPDGRAHVSIYLENHAALEGSDVLELTVRAGHRGSGRAAAHLVPGGVDPAHLPASPYFVHRQVIDVRDVPRDNTTIWVKIHRGETPLTPTSSRGALIGSNASPCVFDR